MGCHIARRIEAPELLDPVYPGYLQVEHDLPLFRGEAPDQVDEFLVGLLLQALAQLLGVLPQGCRQ
ncbi:hypothetical protein D3C81_1791630 [compost metagenome]